MIRTLQQKIVSLQQDDFAATGDYEANIKVYAECAITDLLLDGDRVAGAFGYFRENGEFILFEAPAIVLATGGVGKSYKVTSNSWEYTGDGHALALRAGSTLINMEFLQFHPTGMVWPPSVKGILVTESVRGDGGVLKNSDGKRFMFDYVPDVFRKQYAETEEEADRWYTDPDNNRRPPELLPRDEVARAINSEVKAGRGTPAGGVYLDIASPAYAGVHPQAPAVDVPPVQGAGRRRHHQAADGDRPDLPLRDGWRRGRPGHRRGGRPDRRACSRRARSPAACTAPTGSAATRCPTCWSSASGPASTRRRTPTSSSRAPDRSARRRSNAAVETALAPLNRGAEGENPYDVWHDLQEVMQNLVGIIRRAGELEESIKRLAELRGRVANVGATGGRKFNPGWHLALDLRNMLVVSECTARAALEREESRGGHTREDFPTMDPKWRQVNLVCSLNPTGDGVDLSAQAGADAAARAARPVRRSPSCRST